MARRVIGLGRIAYLIRAAVELQMRAGGLQQDMRDADAYGNALPCPGAQCAEPP